MHILKRKLDLKLFLKIFRILFGSVFLLSAIMKLIDINSFMIALGKFEMLNIW